MDADEAIAYLRAYEKPLRIMEVCGSHTAAILGSGIRELISPAIELVSGPGCPVCVTPGAYIDKLVETAFLPSHTVVVLADLLRVRGSRFSLEEAKAAGASVEFAYSPLRALELARRSPDRVFVVAAVGFETTAPVYAVLLRRILASGTANLRLLTALKTMPAVLDRICRSESVDAFLCPGHVSAIIGAGPYRALAEEFGKIFVIAGFEDWHILAAVHAIARLHERGEGGVLNLYGSVVTGRPQPEAAALLERCFVPGSAHWRGIGGIAGSGLYLSPEYAWLDSGSAGLDGGDPPDGCRCGEVILGRVRPPACPLFGAACRPGHAIGPCMASAEGACGVWLLRSGGTA